MASEPNQIVEQVKAIFEKASTYGRAAEIQSAGLFPYFKPVEAQGGVRWMVEGRERLVICSNDYLGLANDDRLKEAARRSLDIYGTSCTGSRFLTGTLDLHERLEEELADFLQVESVLTFSAGFLGCLSVLSALGARRDTFYFDRENHASLYDGARLSFARMRKYRHNAVDELASLMARDNGWRAGKLIVTDGVFSMSGHLARLPEIVELGEQHGAAIAVDDAHSTGVLGANGRGTAEHFGLEGRIDLILGTFSKAFGSVGGFVGGSLEVVSYVKHVARPFIFTASLSGMQVAATLKALEIMRTENWRREKLWENVRFYLNGMAELGFDTLGSESPIVPVLMGEEFRAFAFWKDLWEAGIYTSPGVPPGVPEGECILRTSVTTGHSTDDLTRVLDTFERVGRKHGVI